MPRQPHCSLPLPKRWPRRRKVPLEEYLLGEIGDRLKALANGEGEALLRQFIEEEIAAQGKNPGREMAQLRRQLAEIEKKVDVLLEGLLEETRGFIDSKLRDLGVEQRRLHRRLEELESVPSTPMDADAVLKLGGLATLDDLPRLMASGSLEERKQFMHAFVAGITVHPDEERLDILMRKIPAMALPRPGDSSVGMVAGAGYDRVQENLIVQNVHLRGRDIVVPFAA